MRTLLQIFKDKVEEVENAKIIDHEVKDKQMIVLRKLQKLAKGPLKEYEFYREFLPHDGWKKIEKTNDKMRKLIHHLERLHVRVRLALARQGKRNLTFYPFFVDGF